MERSTYSGYFGDKRLEHRGYMLRQRLFSSCTQSIQALSLNRAEQKAYYRFLHNSRTGESKLIAELMKRCSLQTKGKVVLSIQDTTEVNLSRHKGRLQVCNGLGGIDDSKGIGFKLHPSLVVDAETCFPLGFSSIRMWGREQDKGNKTERRYMNLPIEEKESYKWIEASKQSQETLHQAKAVVIVQDREGDIFEQFLRIPDKNTHLLIRSRFNRQTNDEEGKLWDQLSASEKLGEYQIKVDSDSHGGTPARQARLEVRSIKTSIRPPKEGKGKCVQVYAVEAMEASTENYQGIHWRLLTTWPVEDFDQARLIIEWYSWRWLIEELFRMLKKEGFNIEGSELETGWSIRKLTVMLLDTIMKLMQMHIAYSEPEEANIPDTDLVFSEDEQECLLALNKANEGKTQALKNPFQAGKLNHAVWIISRIGGWKGYSSQRKPGMTTMFKGLNKFYNIYDGWILQKDVGTR
ncbi:transposase for transposon Tn5 [Pedobacter glucosidilyticus]|nr:IS4 family transposase [Pedobacter glucosidilyticus]KHJ39093.1 transposase for transposon Tn5 [Pedobacter glucosidilyticus]